MNEIKLTPPVLNDTKVQDLNKLLNDASVAIHLVDSDGIIIWANQTELDLLGYRYDEYVGHSIEEFHEDSNAIGDILNRLKNKETLRSHQAELRAKDGSSVFVTISSNVYWEGGKFVHTRCFTNDITEKVQADEARHDLEQKLTHSERLGALGVLASGIAHDFNNLLVPILGMSELVQHSLDKDSEAYAKMEIVVRSAEQAKDLVSQILLSFRQSEPRTTEVDVNNTVQRSLSVLRTALTNKIMTEFEPNSECPRALADPVQLQQVISNLCINATQAMPSGGALKLQLDDVGEQVFLNSQGRILTGSFVCLSVIDEGHGMDSETLDRIFEPFYTTKGTQGTGLGLAMALSTIETHGGHIEVESVEDQGSTFRVYLRAYDSRTSGQPKPRDEQEPIGGTAKIMLVDDQEMVAESSKLLIESLGYAVLAYTNPLEAVKDFEADPLNTDLLITDLTMPGMNGVELIERFRQLRPELPVLLCSGDVDMYQIENLAQIEHLEKPYNLVKFSESISNALRGAR